MHKEMTYYLYHIPGKKIGVTRNLNKRVTQQQGYSPDEYEVLDQSTDIDYISSRELELQKSYGYRVDHKPYKQLFKMKINATEQTSTFPVPLNKLKGRLMDEIGRKWVTTHGEFEINMDTIKWIMDNVTTSQFTSERCYIYNKAFANYFKPNLFKQHDTSEFNEYIKSLNTTVPFFKNNELDYVNVFKMKSDNEKTGLGLLGERELLGQRGLHFPPPPIDKE